MEHRNPGTVPDLPDHHGPPCLSLYQPTHRNYPDNEQDPIRFGNLVKRLESSLARKYASREVAEVLEPFRALAEDDDFWRNGLDGLVVMGARDLFRVHRLQRPVPELAVVADSFHTKPLLRNMQSADRFRVLGLNRRSICLYEGNRYALDEVPLHAGVPATMVEALGPQVTEPHLTVASYGGGAAGPAMRHGQGSRKDELETDEERYFRAVDRAILEHHTDPPLPLVLAALPEHRSVFRDLSHNPHLLEDGIDSHPGALSADALRSRVWDVFAPRYRSRLAGLVERFGSADSHGRGSRELEAAAMAAVQGKVDTALIDADRRIPGRVDPGTGRIETGDLEDPDVDDILDDLAELVLDRGGQVVVVPEEDMPVESGVAAIFRY